MPALTIDHRALSVPDGTTILEAAAQAGIAVPTLCHRPELPSLAGCMVCVVQDEASGRLLPACATPAQEGMRILTASPDVLDTRRGLLELLLSNHPADCEGPCQLACPCHFDIPRMLRQVAAEEYDAALATILERLALPVTLGHICPAPCEKACRRLPADGAAVAICAGKRFAGESGRFAPPPAGDTGRRVTIVGAGPTGLAAAFHLRRQGHTCRIVEAEDAPGASLRRQCGDRLPAAALAKDLERLAAIGVTWETGREVAPAGAGTLLAACDALVLAAGAASAGLAEALGVPLQKGLVAADRVTHQTANPRVFAGGAAVQPCRIAATACAHGYAIAANLGGWLAHGRVPPKPHERFRSRAGRLSAETLRGLMTDVEDGPRYAAAAGDPPPAALDPDGIRYEATRCLRCDCLKKESCRLRELCAASHAVMPDLEGARTPPGRVDVPPDIFVEASKCVQCGICVRTAVRMGSALGPSFHGRGFDLRIGPPLGRAWADIPRDVLRACVAACPTGALAAAARA
jgi:ferredoxin